MNCIAVGTHKWAHTQSDLSIFRVFERERARHTHTHTHTRVIRAQNLRSKWSPHFPQPFRALSSLPFSLLLRLSRKIALVWLVSPIRQMADVCAETECESSKAKATETQSRKNFAKKTIWSWSSWARGDGERLNQKRKRRGQISRLRPKTDQSANTQPRQETKKGNTAQSSEKVHEWTAVEDSRVRKWKVKKESEGGESRLRERAYRKSKKKTNQSVQRSEQFALQLDLH